VVAVLTPGIHNSAYFEHAFLADQMGAELVEGHDLRVVDGRIAMRTTRGYTPIDVLYRRIDDDFLDPLNFNPESLLGVPGIMDVYRAGGITIANAPGTGIADDKAIYSYMPDIVEFYTGEKAILKNVPTWRCSDEDSLPMCSSISTNSSSRKCTAPAATACWSARRFETKKCRLPRKAQGQARQLHRPADPVAVDRADPDQAGAGAAPRRSAPLRAGFARTASTSRPGGLTRVALKKGSLVVNSSQGGGTKDTWVLEE
jgi:uncharacterized circularly permuted ATP-grasp superfamily protein